MTPVADITTIALIITGMLLYVAMSVGLIRLRDITNRMYASFRSQTLRLILMLSGPPVRVATYVSAHTATSSDLVLLILTILFTPGTPPTVSNRIGHEAFRRRLVDEDNLAYDGSREQREDNGLKLLTGLMTK